MPDLRPVVTTEQVMDLLTQHFQAPVRDLVPVEGGQVARTFAFRAGEREYILRLNNDNMLTSNLPKEAYVLNKLASTSLPLAPIVHLGRLGSLHFAISHRLPGKMLEEHTPQEVQTFLPQLLDVLEALRGVDVSDTQGYGVFDYQGQGLATSWHACLSAVGNEEKEEDYYGKWYRLFDETFLERDFYTQLYQRMKDLLAYCPEERHLVYGNLSLRNMLAENGRITALLDWLDASYGDFVYDIASLDFWWPPLGLRAAFQQDQQRRQRDLPFYAERLLCYECHHALNGLRFFAKGGNLPAYQMVKGLIQQKIAAYEAR